VKPDFPQSVENGEVRGGRGKRNTVKGGNFPLQFASVAENHSSIASTVAHFHAEDPAQLYFKMLISVSMERG
jgi:predicted cupin superfamily sugar epimerase